MPIDPAGYQDIPQRPSFAVRFSSFSCGLTDTKYLSDGLAGKQDAALGTIPVNET